MKRARTKTCNVLPSVWRTSVSSWCCVAWIGRSGRGWCSDVGSKGQLVIPCQAQVPNRLKQQTPQSSRYWWGSHWWEKPSLAGEERLSLVRLRFRWQVDIHWEMSSRHADFCAATWFSDCEKYRISCHLHSCGRTNYEGDRQNPVGGRERERERVYVPANYIPRNKSVPVYLSHFLSVYLSVCSVCMSPVFQCSWLSLSVCPSPFKSIYLSVCQVNSPIWTPLCISSLSGSSQG